MNAIPKINQKNEYFPPPPAAAGACQLQHPKTLIGLSRRRLKPDDVLKLIDNRQIRWAWDIARRGAGRAEVRIWRESLLAYLARENGAGPASEPLSLAQVITAILPRRETVSLRAATVHGRELQRRLLCSGEHVRQLIADGELCSVGPGRRGISPVLLYQSVFEFLTRRSLSA